MKYHELSTAKTSSSRRVGRGIAAGRGKTAGRGTKGQNSRTGSTRRLGFEGGQNPLVQRLPKLRGFTSHHSLTHTIYTGQLNNLNNSTIDNKILADAGLLPSARSAAKLIAKGEVTKKVSVNLQSASTQAIKQLEKAGGNFNKTNLYPKTKQKKPATHQ